MIPGEGDVHTQELARPGALPREYSSFVGRRSLLAAARAALGTTRLLTLVGPGGVGKTRLSIRLAQGVARFYPDGVWFVDLSELTASDSVADEVGRTFDLPEATADTVARFIGARRALLVLDNCEQVVEDCAAFVGTLLRSCPQVSVVATSRAALRLGAESVFDVEPLQTAGRGDAGSAAVALFLERCAAALPSPTPGDLEAIAEICRRLDGLPLAIELAAARVRALTPAQILDRLGEPLALLTGGDRDLPRRQQGLATAIAWSYELCTEAERALWRRMSVFVGEWDLESAEWMSASEPAGPATLDLVQSLLEKSILRRGEADDAAASYAMLDTIRAFGLEASSAEEIARARSLHRDWYLSRVAALEADWYGPRQAHWLALSRRELPNIRAALEFCISRGDAARAATLAITAWRVVWQAHGRTDELLRWCARILDLDAAPTPELCQITALLGSMEVSRGERQIGEWRIARAVELAGELDDQFTDAFVAWSSSPVLRDLEAVRESDEESLRLQGGANLLPARADVEEELAVVHDVLGHTDVANEMRQKLLDRAVLAGERFETARTLLNLGLIASDRGEFDQATTMLRQSLSLSQSLENPVGVALAEEMLAHVAAASHDHSRAALLLGASFPLGDPAGAVASFWPGSRSFRLDVEDAVRESLGPRAYEFSVAKGRGLSREEGIAYALGAQLATRSASTSAAAAGGDALSARESQVAALVGQGLTDKEIAARLVISPRTAEGHVAKCLMKLGLTSRTQLATWATRTDATAHDAIASRPNT